MTASSYSPVGGSAGSYSALEGELVMSRDFFFFFDCHSLKRRSATVMDWVEVRVLGNIPWSTGQLIQ